MYRRRTALVLTAIALAAISVRGQGQKVAFDGHAAFEYVKALSADGMQGRKSGEPGGAMGADYVVAKLREWGLEPAGSNGTYLQDMTYEYYEAEPGASLAFTAHGRTRDFVYGEDWRQYRYSGSGPFAGEVVFVGYGVSAPSQGYDDYAGVDVRNKLVLFAVDTPRRLEDRAGGSAQLQSRIKAAQDHGARGVLTFRSDAQATGAFFRGNLRKEIYKRDFIILSLETKVVDFIFKWQRADPRYFFQQIDQTGKPQSYELGVQSMVALTVAFDEKRPVHNVLAKIPGTDLALASEYVVVGAHMDHLGIDMMGDVLNGADDNASGTAVVMESARVLKASQFKPKRTIVFALWAAEEEGLLGSKWYTEHPLYPIEKTVAVINLDMEGHGTGKVRVGGWYYAPEAWNILEAGLPKAVLDDTVPNRGGPGGSDHTHFLYNGVPAFMVSTDGPHFKTNRVGDVIGLIKPDILKKSGDWVVSALDVLASDTRLSVLPSRKESFYWRYQAVVNHQVQPVDTAILEHKDVRDPDVDLQFVTIGDRAGLGGDAAKAELMKALWAAKERVAQTSGLSLYGAPSPAGAPMMGPAGPAKTTLLFGVRAAALSGDPRWADPLARQGLAYVLIDQPAGLFAGSSLTPEGRKTVEAAGDANLLLVARGLSPAQAKALLAAVRKPVLLYTNAVPDAELAGLVKSTESTLGLVMGRDETAAGYYAKLDAARKLAGAPAVAIVTESSLWHPQGKAQVVGVIGEMLKGGYAVEDIANAMTNAFTRALTRARSPEPLRRPTT
ncbi:MAG: M20/M25/M40 family metallo-hydrolase [Bacteroidales bacterium]